MSELILLLELRLEGNYLVTCECNSDHNDVDEIVTKCCTNFKRFLLKEKNPPKVETEGSTGRTVLNKQRGEIPLLSVYRLFWKMYIYIDRGLNA